MKVFLLAAAVFLLVIGCVAGSAVYIHRLCGRMETILEQMGVLVEGDWQGFVKVYRAFEGVWENGEVWLHILVGHDAADQVEELFVELGMRYLNGDREGFMLAMERAGLQIEKIKEGERVMVDGIL